MEYKYSHSKGVETSTKDFDNVWESMVTNSNLRKVFISSSSNLYLKEELSEKSIKNILNTLKYQGFREALRPQKTFIQSAMSEYEYLVEKNEKILSNKNEYQTKNLLSHNNGKIYVAENILDPHLIRRNVPEETKNEILDSLIIRKSKVWSKFIDALLTPLDSFIANELKIDYFDFDDFDDFIEQKNLPVEIKKYLVQKTNIERGDIKNQLEYIGENDKYILAVKSITQSDDI